jgi:hypothetical protein
MWYYVTAEVAALIIGVGIVFAAVEVDRMIQHFRSHKHDEL